METIPLPTTPERRTGYRTIRRNSARMSGMRSKLGEPPLARVRPVPAPARVRQPHDGHTDCRSAAIHAHSSKHEVHFENLQIGQPEIRSKPPFASQCCSTRLRKAFLCSGGTCTFIVSHSTNRAISSSLFKGLGCSEQPEEFQRFGRVPDWAKACSPPEGERLAGRVFRTRDQAAIW
jgi:hypothetical protein